MIIKQTLLILAGFFLNANQVFANDISGPINDFLNILGGRNSGSGRFTIINLLITVSILIFIYGLLKYLFSDEEKKRKEGINTITYGLIVLVVMVSVWSIVGTIRSTFFSGSTDLQPRAGSRQSVQQFIK